MYCTVFGTEIMQCSSVALLTINLPSWTCQRKTEGCVRYNWGCGQCSCSPGTIPRGWTPRAEPIVGSRVLWQHCGKRWPRGGDCSGNPGAQADSTGEKAPHAWGGCQGDKLQRVTDLLAVAQKYRIGSRKFSFLGVRHRLGALMQ